MTNAMPSERVLVLVNGAHERHSIREILESDGVEAVLCGDIGQLCLEIDRGVGAALLDEDFIHSGVPDELKALMRAQPSWSAYPLLFLSARDGGGLPPRELAQLGNATLLDRPVRARSLLTSVHAALGSRRRQYAAQRAIEDRDAFLAMLGHELRNPLGAISLAVKLLESKSADGVLPREHHIIVRQLRNLTGIVDELLDVARVTHGKVSLNREQLDLGEVVRGAFETLEPRAREHGLLWQLDVQAPAPSISGDRQRLEQVFSNLLVNAVKYTPPGGSVSVEVRRDEEAALVVVRDTGVGLSAEMCARVFEPFAQVARSLDRAQGGLGLGLALVRSVVQLHGGSVHAESPGLSHGTSFIVRLPPAGANQVPARHDASRSSRIVVVEDNDDMRDLLAELLVVAGHQVTSAAGGPEGLEKILSSEPDIAFIDIGLPGYDGHELARRVRSLGSKAWLVALSGFGEQEDRKRSDAVGFDDHLVKPVAAASLDETIRRAYATVESEATKLERR
ncbi:MAG TPA: hybrid sensor histidine kinase/response regulator [Polyangiaceae bacterium]|nr:hybrid sensor histidine kinase/response regulator [Polyangiaceae bacterium]